MKRLITIGVFLLFAIPLLAQDAALLNDIKNANNKIKSFESDVTNTMVKPKKSYTQEGKLYYSAPTDFSAQFTTGKYIITNEKRMKMNIGLFNGTFKLRDGGMMQSLSKIFLYGFQGRIDELAKENNYQISTTTEDSYHLVTCFTQKKKIIGIGYKKVIFKYQTDDLHLKEIVLFDYSGNVDTYTISNVQYNAAVDKNLFEF